MQTSSQIGHDEYESKGRGRTEERSMECILCFALLKTLREAGTGNFHLPAGIGIGGSDKGGNERRKPAL